MDIYGTYMDIFRTMYYKWIIYGHIWDIYGHKWL